MNREIGVVYADALFAVAEEQGDAALRSTREDLRQCAVLLSLHPNYTRLLSLPTLPIGERAALAEAAFGTEGLLPRLVRMLIERNRISYLVAIADAFDARMLTYENTVVVTVTTAIALTPDQLERLTATFSCRLQKTIRVKERIDRSILGGVIVQCGDTRIDNSLAFRLEVLRAKLES